MLPKVFKIEKIEEEELRVTDWEILMGFVASGVEPRGINLVDNFGMNIKKFTIKFKKMVILKL